MTDYRTAPPVGVVLKYPAHDFGLLRHDLQRWAVFALRRDAPIAVGRARADIPAVGSGALATAIEPP